MAKKIIAFDIGGTTMRASIVKENKILKRIQIPTPKDKKLFISKIEELIEELNPKNAKGIGIAIAGLIKDGQVKDAPNLALKNFNLKKHLEKKYKKKVEVKNDAGCFALAESKLGIKAKNFILITLGTGIGGGIVINGEEYRGTGFGAEFGHMYVGEKHWETHWQNTRKKIKREFKKQLLFKDLIKINNPSSRKILDETTDYLGKGIASLVNAFDPEIVIIGGGIREAGDPFLNLVKKKVKKYSFLPKNTPIVWTKLEHPGTLGASLLV